jgi:hypothetical protein
MPDPSRTLAHQCQCGISNTAILGLVVKALISIGPAPAIRKLLDRSGHRLAQIDAIEINEAFATQVLAVTRDRRPAVGVWASRRCAWALGRA